jgi:kynurenine formamidase
MTKIVDLTHPIHEGMLRYDRPWHVAVSVEQLADIPEQGRATRRLVLGSHTGTHVDAPAHFVPDGGTIENLDLEALLGPAVLLNFTELSRLTEITRTMLSDALGGAVPERLVLRYDWDRYWGDESFYKGHPYLSEEAAQWLVDGGIRLLGMDTAQPDNPEPGPDAEDAPIHKIILGSRVVLLEYLCNLDQLTSREITIIALPLKVVGSDGAPTRCVAIDAPLELIR